VVGQGGRNSSSSRSSSSSSSSSGGGGGSGTSGSITRNSSNHPSSPPSSTPPQNMSRDKKAKTRVRMVDVNRFLLQKVGKREIPNLGKSSPPPVVVMKLDVEGAEWKILPRMVTTRSLCQV